MIWSSIAIINQQNKDITHTQEN